MITIPPQDDPAWQSFRLFVENLEESMRAFQSGKRFDLWKEDIEIKLSAEAQSLETFEIELTVEGDRQAYGGYPLKIRSCVYISSKCGDLFPEDLWFTKEWFSENPEPSWDEVYPIVEELIEGAIAEFREQFIALRDDLVRLLGAGVRQGEQEE